MYGCYIITNKFCIEKSSYVKGIILNKTLLQYQNLIRFYDQASYIAIVLSSNMVQYL